MSATSTDEPTGFEPESDPDAGPDPPGEPEIERIAPQGYAVLHIQRGGKCIAAKTSGQPWPRPDELVGHSFGHWLPGSAASTLQAAVQKALDSGEAREVVVSPGKPGEPPGLSALLCPIGDEVVTVLGQLPGNEQGPATSAPASAQPGVQPAPAAGATFSMDLRDPVRALHTHAKLLDLDLAGELEEEDRGRLQELLTNAGHLNRMVGDLSELQRVQEGPDVEVAVDTGMVMDRVERTLEGPLRQAGVVLTRDDMPVVQGDPSQLTLLLECLLTSVVDRAEEDRVRVHLAAESEGDRWRFKLTDDAQALDERGVSSLSGELEDALGAGTDIRLALARAIVEGHGGRIEAVSDSSGGKAIVFELPGGTGS